MYITKLHRLVNNTLSLMFHVAKTVAIIKQIHKSTHYEEKKTINLRMFLCVLTGKKRLTAQSIQKSIIWCPISIKNTFYVLRLAKDLWLISIFKTLSFFISSLISFIILEILLFSLTLKSLIYFIPMWGREATERCSIELAITNGKSIKRNDFWY